MFSDFCELLACSYANVAPNPMHEKREARYLKLIGKYQPDEQQALAYMNACLVSEMERKGFDDVLGSIFMELELGSHWHGQFFTPYCIGSMMARMTLDAEHARKFEIIRWHEPACGAGAMMIAVAEALHAHEINPQQMLHTTAIDIDPLCVHMAVIQLSVLGLPAVVHHGNTLSGERWDRWCTPAHVLGLWDWKLKRADARVLDIEATPESVTFDVQVEPARESTSVDTNKAPDTTSNKHGQMALF